MSKVLEGWVVGSGLSHIKVMFKSTAYIAFNTIPYNRIHLIALPYKQKDLL